MSKKRIHWLRLLAAFSPVITFAALYPLGYLAGLLITMVFPTVPMHDGFWDTMGTGVLAFTGLYIIAVVLYGIGDFATKLFWSLISIAELLYEWIYNDK